MPKVTYLFGAGASCHCLPTVEEIPNCLDALLHLFTNNPFPPDQFALNKLHSVITEGISDLKLNARLEGSVDMHIKNIFLETNGSSDTSKLIAAKVLLTISFIYEQIRNPTDFRYRPFFIKTLRTSNLILNENIRIVSWNYDFQFEKAYGKFINSKSLTHIQEKLRVVPRSLQQPDFAEKFSIFKLNGTTSFYDSSMQDLHHPLEELAMTEAVRIDPLPEGVRKLPVEISKEIQVQLVYDFSNIYLKALNDTKTLTPLLSFGFEGVVPREVIDRTFNNCLNSIENTKVLVIIGYSFPDFNRKIDRMILSKLHHKSPIYIQDPRFDEIAYTLRSNLPTTGQHEIIEVTNLKEFFIPNELLI